MPWHIVSHHSGCPESKPHAVVKDADGSVVACHATKKDAEDHMAALYASEKATPMTEPNLFAHPAHVRQVGDAQRATLLDLIRQRHVLDASILEEHPPYFWRAEISNSQLDAYFTHMTDSTLRNYAADAAAGVAFLRGHNVRELPLGRSLTGTLQSEGNVQRVTADFYTLPGLPETNDLIHRMRAGIVSDVSVGFGGGSFLCDICNRELFDWDCRHIPGLTYEEKGPDGVIRQQLATFRVEDAHLYEVSGVYAGATPDAAILKATRMAEAGQLRPEQARVLEDRYRIQLPGGNRAYAGVSLPERSKSMGAEQELQQIRETLEGAGVTIRGTVADAITQLAAELDRLRTEQKRLPELETQAADGRQYRSDLVAEALAEGVRAQGKDFDSPTYEAMLKTAPLATIKRMRDDWKRIGDSRFPGGRQTVDEGQTGEGTPVQLVPDSFYAS